MEEEKEKNTKKNKIVEISIGIIAILCFVAVGTYAYWTLTRKQMDTNIVNTACLDFNITSEGTGINLTNSYPERDEDGVLKNGYTFTVTNNCNSDIDYNVELEPIVGSNFDQKFIRFNLDYFVNGAVEKSRMDSVGYMDDGENGKLLDSYTVAANSSNSHELKLWIDEYAPVENQSKTFNSKVNIVSGQGIKAPSVLLADTIGDEALIFSWYDNGDLFITVNDPDYGSYYENEEVTYSNYFFEELMYRYVLQSDLFTDSEKNNITLDLGYLYLALAPNRNSAINNQDGYMYLETALDDSDESNFQDVLKSNFISKEFKRDKRLAERLAIYEKFENYIPKFKRVYVNLNTVASLEDGLLHGFSADRLSLKYSHPNIDGVYDIGLWTVCFASFDTIDLRATSDVKKINGEFGGIYAPHARLIMPNVPTNVNFGNLVLESLEFTNPNISPDEAYTNYASYCPKIIYPAGTRKILEPYGEHANISVLGHLPKANVEIYFRGPESSISNDDLTGFKQPIHWNYKGA